MRNGNLSQIETLRKENEKLQKRISELEASQQVFLEEQEQFKALLAEQNKTFQSPNRGISSRIISESRAALARSRQKQPQQPQ